MVQTKRLETRAGPGAPVSAAHGRWAPAWRRSPSPLEGSAWHEAKSVRMVSTFRGQTQIRMPHPRLVLGFGALGSFGALGIGALVGYELFAPDRAPSSSAAAASASSKSPSFDPKASAESFSSNSSSYDKSIDRDELLMGIKLLRWYLIRNFVTGNDALEVSAGTVRRWCRGARLAHESPTNRPLALYSPRCRRAGTQPRLLWERSESDPGRRQPGDVDRSGREGPRRIGATRRRVRGIVPRRLGEPRETRLGPARATRTDASRAIAAIAANVPSRVVRYRCVFSMAVVSPHSRANSLAS